MKFTRSEHGLRPALEKALAFAAAGVLPATLLVMQPAGCRDALAGTSPASQARITGSVLSQPPLEGQIAGEYDEIRAILDYHEHVQRVDGRQYGLPENDFDDTTLISLRQRRWFRSEYPGTPAAGIVQYPRFAFELVRKLDEMHERQDLMEEAADPLAAALAGLPLSKLSQNAVGPDALASLLGATVSQEVNVPNDTASESESYLAIDPANQRYMVGGANNNNGNAQFQYRSADWGSTWQTNLLPISCLFHSDPGGAFDSLGNAYSITLEYSGTACGSSTKVQLFRSTDHGATWSAPSVISSLSGNDKELMTIDSQVSSVCRDHLYAVWDKSNSIYTAAAANWLGPWTVTSNLDTNSIGSDIAVGPNGEVYAAWNNFTTKGLNFTKSLDCGATWSPKATVTTTVDAYDYGIPATCIRRALIYPSIDVDRSNGPRRGWIYVAWNDFSVSSSSGCTAATSANNANIWFSRSTDGGSTWSAPKMVHANLPMTDQFNQWMRVDDADGAIHVSWHDTRNDLLRVKTDVYYTRSFDGGTTFDPEIKVTSQMTDEAGTGHNGNQYGDYEGLAVRNGVAYPFWTDRRTSSGTDEEIFTAPICSDPKSIGATTAGDASVCTAGSIVVSWSAPSTFWGDGGAGTRKYQLFKDGVLAVDNIAETATSLSFNPGDPASHSYVVKAVNSCGNVSAYTPATAADASNPAPPPPASNAVTLAGKSPTIVAWPSAGAGALYEVTRGSLAVLASSGGNFTSALNAISPGSDVCMADGIASLSVIDTKALPPAGGGWFYLVRTETACGVNGSFNEGVANQIGDRDPEIQAASNHCP